jgi:cytochrome P450
LQHVGVTEEAAPMGLETPADPGREPYDLFGAEARDDPFTLFARMRTQDPLLATDFGYWYVTRYEDAAVLLRDPGMRAGRGVPDSLGLGPGPLRTLMETWMMARDGVEHTHVRKLISRVFTPRAVEALRPQVEQVTNGLVAGLVAAGGGDVIPALAFPLPMEVMRLLFGVDAATWRERVAALFDPAGGGPAFTDQLQQLITFLQELVGQRRGRPGEDMFSRMFAADEDGDVLSDDELVANGVLLITAGFETTMSLIALAVHTLLRHPDQLELLRTDWSLARGAVEEVLRYEPAALSTTRSTSEPLTLHGQTIPAGANVIVAMAGVNRDPAHFADPDHFLITRTGIRPLTFGGGAHLCIGAGLARLEAEVAITTLFRAAPSLRLPDDFVTTWHAGNPTVRRPESVPVLL